jgi:transposase-like protein
VSLFKRRRFPVEIILLCVRWYCKYGISYRDLAKMTQERGVNVDPSTLCRWGSAMPRSSRSGSDVTRGLARPRGA